MIINPNLERFIIFETMINGCCWDSCHYWLTLWWLDLPPRYESVLQRIWAGVQSAHRTYNNAIHNTIKSSKECAEMALKRHRLFVQDSADLIIAVKEPAARRWHRTNPMNIGNRNFDVSMKVKLELFAQSPLDRFHTSKVDENKGSRIGPLRYVNGKFSGD